MDFSQLLDDLYGHGLDYLADTAENEERAKRWINQAYLEACATARYPFLEETSTGSAPLTISDLDTVISVGDPTSHRYLNDTTEAALTAQVGDLTATGTPMLWYLTGGDTVTCYPSYTGSITVRYYKVPAELDNGSDAPIIPSAYHDVITLGALRRAAIDNQAFETASFYRQEWDSRVQDMRTALISIPGHQQITHGAEDW